MKNLTIPDSVKKISDDAFYFGYGYSDGLTFYCTQSSYARKYAYQWNINCIFIRNINPMKLKVYSKTLSFKTLKAKKLTYTLTFKTKAKGKVTYILNSAARKAKIQISSKGMITVPKGCTKGTYAVTVKAAGNGDYKAGSATFKLTVK